MSVAEYQEETVEGHDDFFPAIIVGPNYYQFMCKAGFCATFCVIFFNCIYQHTTNLSVDCVELTAKHKFEYIPQIGLYECYLHRFFHTRHCFDRNRTRVFSMQPLNLKSVELQSECHCCFIKFIRPETTS